MKTVDCTVIGSGVAGMTAAIYLKRAGVDVLLLEKSAPGGQINKTSIVENYPGFKQIDGPTLAISMFEQVEALDIPYQYGNVLSIEEEENMKIVHTDMEDIKTKRIIIATGRRPRKLGLENEEKLIGGGISYCATCDGMLYKDKEVAVIGGGNSALEEALYLSDLCSKVYIIHRRSEYRADKIFIDKIHKRKNIIPILETEVKKIKEQDGKVSSILLSSGNEIPVTGIFIYIGQVPETEFLDGLCKTKNNYLVVNEHLETNIKGIYACGDVIKKELYQIATAVGEGALAATNVIKSLK